RRQRHAVQRVAGLEVLAIRWQREADDSVGACLEEVG
ncbi:hypothetical protein ACV34G_32745, partial [Pseudomonas aeruginosa]